MAPRIFQYGRHRYAYRLLKQDRSTLSLTVEPCMDIVLKVPLTTTDEQVKSFLEKKWMWLHKQLTFFEKYRKKTYLKEYVSGEGFYYLGRQYKLVVQPADLDSVSLSKGRLTVFTTANPQEGAYNRKLLERWYRERTKVIFSERYTEMLRHFDYSFTPELTVRRMPKRWGSCIKGERIILNPLLIQAPKEAIDYVITHELCHMKYKNHDRKFYDFLETKFPNWQKTKHKLELML